MSLKIAIVNRHPADVLGGSEMQCDNIATGLSAKGHSVAYIAPEAKAGKDYGRNYEVVPVDSRSSAIAEAVVRQKPDIVYWRFNKYFLYESAKAIAKANIPFVFAVSHINDIKRFSYYENPRAGLRQLVRAVKQGTVSSLNHRGYRFVDGLTSLNPDYLGLLPIREQRFIPNSVNVTAEAFSWPRPYVAWVANIKPTKQPEIYIRLAKALADRNVDFLMIGGIQSEGYRYVATENGRTPHFHYLGAKTIEQVNGILAQSLVLAHTCKPEGFGNNFIQAWFQGKPTVSFQFDPAGCIAAHDLGGFSAGRFALFTQQVARLIDEPATREAVGRRAQAYAVANFSLERTVDSVENFMTDIIAGYRRAPAPAAPHPALASAGE